MRKTVPLLGSEEVGFWTGGCHVGIPRLPKIVEGGENGRRRGRLVGRGKRLTMIKKENKCGFYLYMTGCGLFKRIEILHTAS
jgi:hypothetical protein